MATPKLPEFDIFLSGKHATAAISYIGEESPDFAGKDTREILGAARLRKVQQKTARYLYLDRQDENARFRIWPPYGNIGRCKPYPKQECRGAFQKSPPFSADLYRGRLWTLRTKSLDEWLRQTQLAAYSLSAASETDQVQGVRDEPRSKTLARKEPK